MAEAAVVSIQIDDAHGLRQKRQRPAGFDNRSGRIQVRTNL